MSYTIGTWTAPSDGPLAGTRVEVTRADGKGFTACRVTGPRAAEIRDFVKAMAEHVSGGERVARDVVRGAELGAGFRILAAKRRTPHVREVWACDYEDGARAVHVHGRLRQTRDVIVKALELYSFHVASNVLGVDVPIIRLAPPVPSAAPPPAAPGPCGAGKVGWCGLGPGEEP